MVFAGFGGDTRMKLSFEFEQDLRASHQYFADLGRYGAFVTKTATSFARPVVGIQWKSTSYRIVSLNK